MNKEQTNYITPVTRLPRYLPYPEFLLTMEISQTAKVIYALLLHRAMLSQKNGWIDESGNVYLIFTMEELAEASGKCMTTVKAALNDLSVAGLIERRRVGYSAPSRIYVKLPGNGQKTDHHMVGKLTVTGSENRPLVNRYKRHESNKYFSGQKTVPFPIPDYDCEEGASL